MLWFSNWNSFNSLFLFFLPINMNGSGNRFLSWPSNCYCFTIIILFHLSSDNVALVSVKKNQNYCFVSCLLMERVHTTINWFMLWSSSWNCFNTLLLVLTINRKWVSVPDLFQLHRCETFHLFIDICSDLSKSILAAIPINRQPQKTIVTAIGIIPINRRHPKSLEAAIPNNRQQPK